jgi:hypothetical protein
MRKEELCDKFCKKKEFVIYMRKVNLYLSIMLCTKFNPTWSKDLNMKEEKKNFSRACKKNFQCYGDRKNLKTPKTFNNNRKDEYNNIGKVPTFRLIACTHATHCCFVMTQGQLVV